MPLSDLSDHLNECTKLVAQGCPYTGCSFKPANGCVEKLRQHLHEAVILHAYLQTSVVTDVQNQLIALIYEQQKTLAENAEKDNAVKTMRIQMTEMEKSLQMLLTDKQKQNEIISKMEEKIDALEKKSATKRNDSSNPIDVTRLSTDVARMNKSIADLDLRQQLFENTNYDGKLVWKIDNIESRMQQAKTGRVTALHSAPAFTERHGYKFCARLYLNGDGLGKCSHVSLFFVLMKSEYDSLLQWPFDRRVTLRLINQKGKPLVEESFNPDRQSSSFIKPVRDMNIASGCPQLVTIDHFMKGGFVTDNCVFIELEIGRAGASPGTSRK